MVLVFRGNALLISGLLRFMKLVESATGSRVGDWLGKSMKMTDADVEKK